MQLQYKKFAQTKTPRSKFRRPGNYAAPPTRKLKIDDFVVKLRFQLGAIEYTQSSSDNVTKAERKVLLDLQNIVINKVDKDLTIVVQDKETYLQEGLKHLSNQ